MAIYISSLDGLGRAVRHLREQQGMTQRELCERVGISYNAIGLLEAGRFVPSFRIILLLAGILGREVALDVARPKPPAQPEEKPPVGQLRATSGARGGLPVAATPQRGSNL